MKYGDYVLKLNKYKQNRVLLEIQEPVRWLSRVEEKSKAFRASVTSASRMGIRWQAERGWASLEWGPGLPPHPVLLLARDTLVLHGPPGGTNASHIQKGVVMRQEEC